MEISRQAASSLEAAHEMGIVHRDIKPANVLLSRHGVVKLTDFGLAQLHGASDITMQCQVLGTPYYMSPEQARGGQVGPQSDLYSLGATLYHLLTGQPPFDAPSPIAVMAKHLDEAPRPPGELAPGLPRGVSELVLRLMDKSPAGRPASATVLKRHLGLLGRMAICPEDVLEAALKSRPPAETDEEPSAAPATLGREEMRELLAFEATRLCLMPRPRRAFLEATMRNYRIPPEQMCHLFAKPAMVRNDVWQLQILKRLAEGKTREAGIVRRLMALERRTSSPLGAGRMAERGMSGQDAR